VQQAKDVKSSVFLRLPQADVDGVGYEVSVDVLDELVVVVLHDRPGYV
jgi:hypothetical protein